jgi:hypothetical protein
MTFKAYYREDIRNALEAAQMASEGSAALLSQALDAAQIQDVPVDRALDIYQQGFRTALATVARTFGVDIYAPVPVCLIVQIGEGRNV